MVRFAAIVLLFLIGLPNTTWAVHHMVQSPVHEQHLGLSLIEVVVGIFMLLFITKSLP